MLSPMEQAIAKADIRFIDNNLCDLEEYHLCFAGSSGRLEVAQYFHYMGYDSHYTISQACEMENCDVVDWFVSIGVPLPYDILYYCCVNGNLYLFNLLLQAGANIEKDIPNVFVEACRYSREEMVLQLYNYGADVNQKYDGATGMNIAVINQNVNMVKLLLNLWAIPTKKELTAACFNRKVQIIKLLLSNKSDIYHDLPDYWKEVVDAMK